MEKVKITKISRNEKTSAGGKKYISLGVQVEGKEAWINGFGNKDNQDWKEGDEVEIKIVEKVVNGKTYLNFETPKKEDKIQDDITKILNALQTIKNNQQLQWESMEEIRSHNGMKPYQPKVSHAMNLPDYPENEDEIPF